MVEKQKEAVDGEAERGDAFSAGVKSKQSWIVLGSSCQITQISVLSLLDRLCVVAIPWCDRADFWTCNGAYRNRFILVIVRRWQSCW